MATPLRIDELPAVTSLSTAAAVAIVQAGVTRRTTPAAFITEAESFTASGSDAVARTVDDKLKERAVSVFDFMTEAQKTDVKNNTGSLNVLAACRSAHTAAKHVYYPQGTYNLGSSPSGNVYITVDGDAGRCSVITEGMVKFVVDTGASTYPIFRVIDAHGVKIGSIHCTDNGYNHASSTFNGATAVLIEASSGLTLPVKNVEIDSIYAENMGAALLMQGNTSTVRVEGIRVNKIYCDTCYYGVNCQNNGDALSIGLLWTDDVKRSYFFYGTRGSKVFLYSTNQANSTGDLNISVYSDGLDTTDHEIHYISKTPVSTTDLISFNALGEGSKKIQNIMLHLDLESTTAANVLSIRAYNLAGTVENTGATNNVFDDLKITGRIVAASATKGIHIACQPSTKGVMEIAPSINYSTVDSTIYDYFTDTRAPKVLQQSGAAVSVGVTTAETTLVTITVPAYAMGKNGTLRILTTWTTTNGANDKTLRIRFSGASGTQFLNTVITTNASVQIPTWIQNRNATNSQVGWAANNSGGVGGSSSAVVTASVDTTADTTLVITGQKEVDSETLTLERYVVELLHA